MVLDLPFAWCKGFAAISRFSLSDENDAAGEGESDPKFGMRDCLGCVNEDLVCPSSSSSFSAGGEILARRAIRGFLKEFVESGIPFAKRSPLFADVTYYDDTIRI